MRVVSPELDAEVAGTTVGDRLEVHAWRGGVLVAPDLPVSSWSLGWDAGRQVQGQGSFTVADPDGVLAPWGFGDALAPGGTRLRVTWVSGSGAHRVPLGVWRIRTADPREQWRLHRAGAGVARVPGGGDVKLFAEEETHTIGRARLDAEVPTAGTCVAEVRRLLEDLCPVVVDEAVTDRAVPSGLVYGDSRLDAVQDLLDVVDATYRMGPDGALQVIPAGGVGPVWAIVGGDDGALVSTDRSLSDEDVYNAAISFGKTPGGRPLVGRAFLSSGPLAYDGPFGPSPIFHQSVASTQDGVVADAATLLTNRQVTGEADLSVTCLTHPALQLHDRVTVVAPTQGGDEAITGRVVAMSMRSATSDAGTVPAKAMSLVVRVSVPDLEAIAARARRG